MNRSQGFTLIELLVVIAIIGILSAVVLASLNTARSKGNDAAVESDLNTVHTEAEIAYSTDGNSYNTGSTINSTNCSILTTTGTIFGDPVVQNALKGAQNAIGNATNYPDECSVAGNAYMIAMPTSHGAWCIDSTGVSRNTTSAGAPYLTALQAYTSGNQTCN